jgi:hypothetical protein
MSNDMSDSIKQLKAQADHDILLGQFIDGL